MPSSSQLSFSVQDRAGKLPCAVAIDIAYRASEFGLHLMPLELGFGGRNVSAIQRDANDRTGIPQRSILLIAADQCFVSK